VVTGSARLMSEIPHLSDPNIADLIRGSMKEPRYYCRLT
jgi:hypothetical protein